MIAPDDMPPVGRTSRGLLRRFWVVSACIGLCCSVLAAPMLSSQWRDFTRSRSAVQHLTAFEGGLAVLNRVSAERGPTNGSLGAEPDDASRWRSLLVTARISADAALAQLRSTLTASGLPEADALVARIEQTARDLAHQRDRVDGLVAMPRERRGDEPMERTIDGMIGLVPPLMRMNLQLGTTIGQWHPFLLNTVPVATFSASLREYAGELGSHLVIVLLKGEGVGPERARAMDQLAGRIEQLRQAIDARLASAVNDPELTALGRDLDRHYFQTGLALVDAVRRAEAARPGSSGVSAGAFTERYVPEMAAITAIRDRMLDRAKAETEAHRTRAFLGLCVGAAMVAVIFALLAATARVVHRDVVQPLIATTQRINDLVAERFDATVPEGRHVGEIGDMIQAITVLRGVSIQRRHLQQEREGLLRSVRQLAETDHLTGLPNRRTFDILTSDAVARGDGVTLILCDIDRFKAINDLHGHLVGDHVLRVVAQRLRAAMRGSDTVFRYGGEEFAVMGVGENGAGAVADRLRESIAETPIVADGTAIAVTLSAGVAWLPAGPPEAGLSDLVARADRALYRAKRDGRNRTRSESPETVESRRVIARSPAAAAA